MRREAMKIFIDRINNTKLLLLEENGQGLKRFGLLGPRLKEVKELAFKQAVKLKYWIHPCHGWTQFIVMS